MGDHLAADIVNICLENINGVLRNCPAIYPLFRQPVPGSRWVCPQDPVYRHHIQLPVWCIVPRSVGAIVENSARSAAPVGVQSSPSSFP